MGKLVVPENVKLSNPTEAIYSLIDSPSRSRSPAKLNYKPPTPPRSFKRKSSPKSYNSPPPATHISTPTLSSSSASNYSSNSPYQPVAKPTYKPTTYSAPYKASYATNYYNPEENDQMNSYDSNSQDSYHIPGANPPPPEVYPNPRNPSPTFSDSRNGSNPPYNNPPPDYIPTTNTSTYDTGKSSRKYSGYDEPPVVPPPPDYSVPPPTEDYRPFYSSNNLTVPPLLGEDCPPTNVNGLDSFLQSENSLNEDSSAPAQMGSGSGFSSFMGNLNLPFDFQKGLFSESCDDTPASPPLEGLDDNTSHYFSDSNQEGGKPIEVINRTKQPDLSEILKAISMQPPPAPRGDLEIPTVPPITLPPPPLPPTTLAEPPLLPPKFPTWGQGDNWPDTPASPPLYEKSGFGGPAEFEEPDSLTLGDTDTDMRSVRVQGDIDHRNLISLTSSPRDENPWANNQDTDYRKMALAPKRGTQDVNVESVDMEMSSDEEMDTESKTQTQTSVSFSLAPSVKPLVDSPLKEREEPKKKLLSVTLTPPPKLPEPPPLPDVDEIFTEINETKKLTPPPLPPPVPPSLVQQIPTLQEPNAPRGPFPPRFNNPRPRFPQWQNNQSPRPRQPPMVGPRFRPDGNFRGRPPWFRGNRPPRFGGW
ncbi:uncharacterized protein LOC128996809 [Macrosteles quadrilineatus]|uniref:uncharacterized protein LOC128996809 n=1 Tax=Macrosteles quadrilineatus TaxID=74068 RepID=UPI0023E1F29F|nr:uncharacterized protein LOC128996809 [Macrosteles quadrilineatus]